MSTMGTLSRHSDTPAAAVSAAASAATATELAADAAPDTTPSVGTETDQRDLCSPDGASGKEREACTWETPASEKSVAAPVADTESPETYSGGSVAAKEEQLLLHQLQQPQQQGENEGEPRSDGSLRCALCSKQAPNSDITDGSSWICDSCSNKQQQQGTVDELRDEVPSPEGPSAAVEDTEASHSHEGLTETADSTTAKLVGISRSACANSSSVGNGPSISGARGRGSPGGAQPAAAAPAGGGIRKCIDEGSVRRHVVPVGPRHQVPCLPPFFLEAGGPGCCWGGEPTPVLDPSLTARLVYSPSSLERVRQRRLAEGLADRAICSEGDMEAFMQQCAKNWKANKPGWQPFSPEFAFKLLHYAGYDPAKALQLMEDPQFPFQLVCDGPVRRYDNKWRPKDRRGVISPTPYPPPVFLRGYLSRRHYRDSSGYSLR